MPDPLLVATDGGARAAIALEAAATYASAEGIPVEVVSVVEPLSGLPMALPHREELERAHSRAVALQVRERIRDTVGRVDWPVHVRWGRPAQTISLTARDRNARMIVLGLDPARGAGNAIAVELLHLVEAPVLITAGAVLPRTAVVGVDLRITSYRAASEAARLIGGRGPIHLVHVKPPLDFPAASVWGWDPRYETATNDAFDGMARAVARLGAGEVQRHRRSGDPAKELVRAAEELDAGLLAIGSGGYICNGRVVLGGVARRIIADAAVTILATPVVSHSDASSSDVLDTRPAAGHASARVRGGARTETGTRRGQAG